MPRTDAENKIVIDVKGISLGRAASAVALALRGKNRSDFAPNKLPGIVVEIKNYDKIKISEKKKSQKIYKQYSGYPSGLKKTKLVDLYKKDPKEVFLRAVRGMLPKNKLQKQFLKNMIFV